MVEITGCPGLESASRLHSELSYNVKLRNTCVVCGPVVARDFGIAEHLRSGRSEYPQGSLGDHRIPDQTVAD